MVRVQKMCIRDRVGVVQAFVFTVLTAVYIGLICNHEGGDHDHDEAHGDANHPAH